MRARSGSLRPSPEAERLADMMASDTETMREILAETIPDGGGSKVHESGRTVCGSGDSRSIKGPLARFPTSVELAECPRSVSGGTWHTHVTKEELRNPNNSLPDTANVIFGDIDVSAVVGTQSMEMFMAPEDPQQGVEAFQNALGADVSSTEEVVDAIISGEIRNPSGVRQKMRGKMGALFDRRKTNFTKLNSKLSTSSIPAQSPVSIEMHDAMLYSQLMETHGGQSKNPLRDPQGTRANIRRSKNAVKEGVNVKNTVKTVVVSKAVSAALNSVL